MSNLQIPDDWLGKRLDGSSLEKVLQKSPQAPPVIQPVPVITPANNQVALGDYLILPGRKHGNYEYEDTLVAMSTSDHSLNWQDTWTVLQQKGAYMPTIRQFVDFLNLLRSGNAFDGNGQSVQGSRLNQIYNEITQVRDPWRSEWLNAKFNMQVVGKKWAGLANKNAMHISYHTVDPQGVLTEVKEPLESYLTSNKTPGISIDSWLSGATNQGLPSPQTTDGGLYYWAPTDGKVAGFYANSDRANLICDRDPSNRNAGLGVRQCRKKI